MNETDKVKKRIQKELHEKSTIRIYCIICRQHCVTISEQRELVHYECWLAWKRSRTPAEIHRPLH